MKGEQCVEYRNKLISVLSHEVKGLFANIEWMIYALETGMAQPDSLKELLPELKIVADKNLSVFQNTEEWIKLQKKAYKPVVTEIETYLLYQDLRDFFAKQLEAKGLKFLFEGNRQLVFWSDKVLASFVLRRIIESLIAFALPKKEIVLEAAQGTENAVVLHIKTETNFSDLQEIFCSDADFLTGKNLYSALVKDIIKMMNGTIDAGFTANHLFIITITLPK